MSKNNIKVSAYTIGEILYNYKHENPIEIKPTKIDSKGNYILSDAEFKVISDSIEFLTTIFKLVELSAKYNVSVNTILKMIDDGNLKLNCFESDLHIIFIKQFLEENKINIV